MDKNLTNAVIVAENPESSFIIENRHLHAVEERVAALKKSNPNEILQMLRDGLKALIKFSDGKVEHHFLEIDWDALSHNKNEKEELIKKIENIYTHLPNHDRIELYSHVHHKELR